MRIKSLILAALCMVTVGVYAQSNYPFNGLDMNMGNLSRLSDAKTRSISPENFTGEKGKGGMADPVRDKDQRNVANAHHAAKDLGKGWKVNPFIIVKPGETITIAEIEGPGAIQQIWMTPTGNWRFSILRMYWDDEKEPSVECPVGDFFCSAIRLAYGYWKKTNDASPFDAQWKKAIETVLRVCKEQQRKDGNGPYSFRRTSEWAIDAVPMGGVGYKVNPVGLICSTFRPSDDATIFPFLVPSNFFAVASLRQASEMVQKITKDNVLADELLALSKEVYNALQTYAVVNHPKFGKIYAFEIDGFGSAYLSDDANVPNLLALPYLGGVDSDDAIYANTRRFVWSEYNPYFFKGSYFEGIGGHHIGTDMIWPMSLIMKALTAQDDKELQQCIQMLQKTHAGTGFMHESFHKDDPKKFTRSWFAWANTLFGELLWKTFNEKPYLLEY